MHVILFSSETFTQKSNYFTVNKAGKTSGIVSSHVKISCENSIFLRGRNRTNFYAIKVDFVLNAVACRLFELLGVGQVPSLCNALVFILDSSISFKLFILEVISKDLSCNIHTCTHAKISQLVASLPTSRHQVVFALLVPCCQQAWINL